MTSFIQFLVIVAAIAAPISAQQYIVTTSAEDYLTISQKSLLHKIQLVELEIVAVDTRYSDRIDTIELEQQQSLNLIRQVNETLTPLQVLSLVRKHCIQAYAPQQPDYNSYKQRFDACNSKARSNGVGLTTTPNSWATSARSHVVNTMPKNAVNCDLYKNNQTKYELCYEELVQSSTTLVGDYLTLANDSLGRSLFDANTYTRTAAQCSFKVQKELLDLLTATNKLISSCEAELNKPKSSEAIQSYSKPKTIKNLIMEKGSGLLRGSRQNKVIIAK